ncbi:MAG: Adenylosuccinate lyase @ SAICAR lyase [uncultured Thermomicrobiales bacterium]|uniref:Adenylosuccinate lyase n=1 Tax=uncultured Thermomicrobiales bacterium TaxID=1645740 RepID=A0A6J4V0K8_9BACT|nr:MAG: Adenylosuccinate lyase @ SAICAR lyase [uncultured Thermomicrobiales bacterium]
MIERYTRPEMGAIWGDQHKLDTWLAVEKEACEAWYRRGRIPEWAISSIRGATCSLERMREIEAETDHDVIAFLRAMGETVGDASRFIHLGLTSSDVVDTGLAIQSRDAATLITAQLDRLIEATGRLAVAHRHTLMIGRTHGIHAEPTTFGLKVAVWYDELRRHRRRLDLAAEDIATGKISGAVGTHAHVPLELEDEVCAALGLAPAPASTQVVQRDRHAAFIMALAGIGGTLEKIATEIRHLARTEVREVEEPFDAGNMGSSAMPHKRNPHASERVSGLARLLRGYAVTAMENVPLWHERDISHSSAERVIFPDSCIIVDYLLDLVIDLVERLVVYPERMARNVELTGGLVFSQRVLLALVDAGLDRTVAYKIVQRHALAAWDGGPSFREALRADAEVTAALPGDQLEGLFDPWDQLRSVDGTLARLGLLPHDDAKAPSRVDAPVAGAVKG